MQFRDISSIIMFIIIIFLVIKVYTMSNKENFVDTTPTSTLQTITNEINRIYNMDTEAIRNLGAISKSLLTGTNYHSTDVSIPGELTIPADNTIFKGNVKVDGKIVFTNKNTLLMDILPRGIILSFNSIVPPMGWTLCNGLNGAPDLQGRFILGSGQGSGLTNREIHNVDGNETHTLTVAQMPSHNHTSYPIHNYPGSDGGGRRYAGEIKGWGKSDSTGGNQPHNNMPPFYVLTYIMKL